MIVKIQKKSHPNKLFKTTGKRVILSLLELSIDQ